MEYKIVTTQDVQPHHSTFGGQDTERTWGVEIQEEMSENTKQKYTEYQTLIYLNWWTNLTTQPTHL